MRRIPEIKPFLASLSYLSIEAQKQRLQEVLRICSNAEREISQHIIDELFCGEIKKGCTISERDYQAISDILVAASRMSSNELDEFIRQLEQEHSFKKVQLTLVNTAEEV